MIYLKNEIEQFRETQAAFEQTYISLLEEMLRVYNAKGETRDVASPIHHRMSPAQMLGLIQAKGRRLDSLMSRPGWHEDEERLKKIIEECVDQANYNLYIATLAAMLLEEMSK